MDNGGGTHNYRTVFCCQLYSLPDGAASGYHIFHSQDALPLPNGKAPSELHPAIHPLTKNSPHTQTGCDLLPDDDTSYRRRQDNIDGGLRPAAGKSISGQTGKLTAQIASYMRVLEYKGTLKVDGTVTPGRQPEVTFQKTPAVAEGLDDLTACHHDFL
jgi:hypothetical protein